MKNFLQFNEWLWSLPSFQIWIIFIAAHHQELLLLVDDQFSIDWTTISTFKERYKFSTGQQFSLSCTFDGWCAPLPIFSPNSSSPSSHDNTSLHPLDYTGRSSTKGRCHRFNSLLNIVHWNNLNYAPEHSYGCICCTFTVHKKKRGGTLINICWKKSRTQ